jgi:hypothetical protein
MTTHQDFAVQLLTASLGYRRTPSGDPYATPEYATYKELLEEIVASGSGASVLIEMTQFAGTAIIRAAELSGHDPVRLWQAIALASARRKETNEDQA